MREAETDQPKQATGLSSVKQAICDRLARGETLTKICKDADMPERMTVYRWRQLDPDFDVTITRAYILAGSAIADEAIERARACQNANWGADRLAVDTLKWAASKFYPKMFGDQQPRSLHQTYVAGDVKVVADESQRQAMIEARGKFLGNDKAKANKAND